MARVEVSGVSKRFAETIAVDGIDLELADGEFVVLLGPTGAGKTTTLRLVAGLEAADSGRISIGAFDVTKVPPAARDVAFVFQQYSLYPHLTVFENLAFPLRSPIRRLPEAEIRQTVTAVARTLRIEDKLGNRATALSGGQMQRVAIGRALVRRPSVYLMDEPLSSLDAKLRADLRLELKRIQTELGATMLYVTHDQIEAMTLADRIGVLDHGRLVQIGPPRQVYEDPATTNVATRLGTPQINLLPRAVLGHLALPPEVAVIGARTEHIRVARGEASDLAGTIRWIEHLGDHNHMHVAVGGTELTVLADPDRPFSPGEEVTLAFERPLLFDASGQRVRH